MRSPSWPELSRRRFLVGGATMGGAILAGCRSGGGTAATSSVPPSDLALTQFFGGPTFVAGREARLPFGVQDQHGLLPVDRTPATLGVQLLGPDGSAVGDPVEVGRRSDGLPRAYFPLVVTLEEPGLYTARTEVDGVAAEMSIKIDSPADVKVIQPGTAMPSLQTPTTTDARGIKPVCTRDPVCPLHDVTVAEVLAGGAPLALLVASPAFCQVSICGPVLDLLVDVRSEHPSVHCVHAEVYADPAKDTDTYAPIVADLGLHFEPCLVLVGSGGRVADRIDTIFDRSELSERLARLT